MDALDDLLLDDILFPHLELNKKVGKTIGLDSSKKSSALYKLASLVKQYPRSSKNYILYEAS